MKDSIRVKAKRDKARDLFAELSEGMKALAEERHPKRKLRTARAQPAKRERSRK